MSSENSRRVQASALYTITLLFTDDTQVWASREERTAAILDFHWWALRKPHLTAIRTRLLNDFTISTVNRCLSALRGLLRACWELGYMSIEDYQRAASVKNVSGQVDLSGRDIPDKEIRQLLISCYEDGKKGVRDLAVLAIVATCGLRRAELAALKYEDLNQETGELKILGKGHEVREVYVLNQTREKLDDWLAVRGHEPGPMFFSFRRGDNLTQNPLGAQVIYDMVRQRAIAAGLPQPVVLVVQCLPDQCRCRTVKNGQRIVVQRTHLLVDDNMSSIANRTSMLIMPQTHRISRLNDGF